MNVVKKPSIILFVSVFAVILASLVQLNFTEASMDNTKDKTKPQYVNTLEEVARLPVIKDKVLSANNQYKSLEGTIIKEEATRQAKVNLWIEQPDRFYVEYIPNIKEPEVVIKAVNDGNEVQVKDLKSEIKRSKPLKPMEKPDKIEDNVIIPDYNGTFLPIGGVNEMIHPEMFAQSAFRRGELEVLGDEKYLDREATILQVRYKESKLGDLQKFWIDKETGIILKTVIYDTDKPIRSVYFVSISFPNNISPDKFKLFTE
ncbi:MAG: hypothetical protein ACPL5F_14085 [Moorellaceae bacterium]